MAEGELKNLIFLASIVAALFYCYFVPSKLRKGIYRLTSLVPVFCLFTVLPLFISSAVATAVAFFFLTWLCNFKLLLFAFDHGPLYPTKSLILFITVACLPVKIKSDSVKPATKNPRLNLWIKALVFPVMINLVVNHRQELNPYVVLIVYCCLIFLMIDLLVFLSNAVTRTAAGVELDASLQEFWGRRWNLMVTNILRHTVYKPVRSIFPVALPAIMATFVISGLMHELLFYYVTRVSPTWEMTMFFVLHGICVAGELGAKRAVAGKWEVPRLVGRLLTVGFLVATSFWLFFPPLIRSGADVKAIGEFKLFFDCVKNIGDYLAGKIDCCR